MYNKNIIKIMSLISGQNKIVKISRTTNDWIRPSDWLSEPTIITGEEVVYLLMAVPEVGYVGINVLFSGAYTVDWGDGSATTNVATNTQTGHTWTYSSLPSSSYCSRGYRQCWVKITPQVGQHLTAMYLDKYIYGLTLGKKANVLDVVINTPYITGTDFGNIGGTYCVYSMCERVWIKEIGAITTLAYRFTNMHSLREVPFFPTPEVTSTASMYYLCYSFMKAPLLLLPKNLDASSMHAGNDALLEVPLYYMPLCTKWNNFVGGLSTSSYPTGLKNLIVNSSAVTGSTTGIYAMCIYNIGLDSAKINGGTSTNATNLFYNCLNLKDVYISNCQNITVTSNMFTTTGNLSRCRLVDITVGFSINGNTMSAEALNEMFTNLGTANGAQTIDVRNNFGAATCDTSIATAKGWTVTIV